eukprot:gene17186-23582_t
MSLVGYGSESDGDDSDDDNGLVQYNHSSDEEGDDANADIKEAEESSTPGTAGAGAAAGGSGSEGAAKVALSTTVASSSAGTDIHPECNIEAGGLDFQAYIYRKREYLNPSIGGRLIEQQGIDQYGTNCPAALFNPRRWSVDDTYETLLEKHKKAKAKQNAVALEEHQSLTKKKTTTTQQQMVERAVRAVEQVLEALGGKGNGKPNGTTQKQTARDEANEGDGERTGDSDSLFKKLIAFNADGSKLKILS